MQNKTWKFIKKNAFTIVMVIIVGVLFFSPDAKSFVLRQIVATGLFNPSIDNKDVVPAYLVNVDFDFVDEAGNLQTTSSLRDKVVFDNFWA